MNDDRPELAETALPDRVYEVFAHWEAASEEGKEFDFSSIEPGLRLQVQRLIDKLSPTSNPKGAEPERPPDTPRYKFLEFIAQGGMGEVWRGYDKRLERVVALKVVRNHWGISHQAFWAESKLVAQMTHPGIAAVFDLDQLRDGRPFFAMKFVEGRTLEQFLKDSADPAVTEPLRIFRQICETMAYAHGQNPPVIHRDLKPQNVMVGIFGEVFVMDWGLAKAVVPNQLDHSPDSAAIQTPQERTFEPTLAGMVKGTYAYMSPEQARGECDQIGPETDVFALGGILCRILTGDPTFCGVDRVEAAERGDVGAAHLRLERSGADSKLVAISKICLSARIEDRFAHAGYVLEAFSDYEHQQRERLREVEFEEARRATRRAEARRRRPLYLGIGMLGTLLLCVLIGLAWRNYLQTQRQQKQRQQHVEQASVLLQDSRRQFDQALEHPLEVDGFRKAEVTAGKAVDASKAAENVVLLGESQELLSRIKAEAAEVKNNELFLSRLLDARVPPRLNRLGGQDDEDLVVTWNRAKQRLLAAFRGRGIELDFERFSFVECKSQILKLPKALRPEVAVAIDHLWILALQAKDVRLLQDLLKLSYYLDDDPRAKRIKEAIVEKLLEKDSYMAEANMLPKVAQSISPAEESVSRIITIYRGLRLFGHGPAASDFLLRAVNEKPGEALLLSEAAELFESSHSTDWGKAAEYRRTLRGIRPHTGYSLAHDLIRQKRPEEAELVIQDVIRHQPNDPDNYVLLGVALSYQGQTGEEEQAYRVALKIDPRHGSAQRQLDLLKAAVGEKSSRAAAKTE